MTDKQLIKQEIERIIEEETPISKGSDYYHGAKESMEKLLQFINSIPEEPASEDLEEAIENWIRTNHFVFTEIDEIIETARHFAEWGRNHSEDKSEMLSEGLEEAAKHYLYGAILYDDVYVGNPTEEDCIRCFKAGTEWQKQQMKEALQTEYEKGLFDMREEMMKDAVEATIFSELKGYDGSLFQAKSDRFRMNGVKISDIIKVIPIKTEQQ